MPIPLLPHNPDWFRQADLLIDDLGHFLGARALAWTMSGPRPSLG
ncbi:MAG: hypothetical protein NXH99_18380 [Rhodobacteraceae bacterium]|nr:hypothetical protein [Paracoccaceae bacterium]